MSQLGGLGWWVWVSAVGWCRLTDVVLLSNSLLLWSKSLASCLLRSLSSFMVLSLSILSAEKWFGLALQGF